MDIARERISLVTVLKFLSIYFNLSVDATGVVCHQLGLLRIDLYAVGCGGFVETLNYFFRFFFLSCLAIDVIIKAEIGDCSASNADSAFMIF